MMENTEPSYGQLTERAKEQDWCKIFELALGAAT